MKTKDVERKTGIPIANIYFYEKEGLLTPGRNKENNYREYTEYDVERLEQIKILRLLGIGIDDIKKIYLSEISLGDAVRERLHRIDEEEEQLQVVRKACENILLQDLKMDMLNEDVLGAEKELWTKHLARVFKEDLTKIEVNRKQMNRQIAGILSLGFLINAIIAFFTVPFFSEIRITTVDIFGPAPGAAISKAGYLFWGMIILFIVSGIVVYWTASLKLHILCFAVSAFLLSPMILTITRTCASEALQRRICTFLPVFWLCMIVFAFVYDILSERHTELLMKVRYSLLYALLSSVMIMVLSLVIFGTWMMPLVVSVITTIYLVLFWSAVNTDVRSYNKYYAVKSAVRMLNPIAIIFSYYGKSKTPMWGDFTEKSN